jgi:hypothetical protein
MRRFSSPCISQLVAKSMCESGLTFEELLQGKCAKQQAAYRKCMHPQVSGMSDSCAAACNQANQCQNQIFSLVQAGASPSTEFDDMCTAVNTQCDNCEGGAPTSILAALAAPNGMSESCIAVCNQSNQCLSGRQIGRQIVPPSQLMSSMMSDVDACVAAGTQCNDCQIGIQPTSILDALAAPQDASSSRWLYVALAIVVLLAVLYVVYRRKYREGR